MRSEIRNGEVQMGGLASATRLALGFGPIAARSMDASDDAAFIADLSEVLGHRESSRGVVYRARYLCFRGQA
ncbi:MAG: hypothetical protein IOD05_07185 [Rhodobacter sp.]|nr:hypothetical protein [Rhodobacter sp.]